MKVFLSAGYSRREELCGYREQLQADGIEVVSTWLDTEWAESTLDQRSAAPPEYRAKYAVIDLDDVRRCHVLVGFTEHPGSGKGRRGGRHVELGAALALDKVCVVVGPEEHIFHFHPSVHRLREWDQCRFVLKGMQGAFTRGVKLNTGLETYKPGSPIQTTNDTVVVIDAKSGRCTCDCGPNGTAPTACPLGKWWPDGTTPMQTHCTVKELESRGVKTREV